MSQHVAGERPNLSTANGRSAEGQATQAVSPTWQVDHVGQAAPRANGRRWRFASAPLTSRSSTRPMLTPGRRPPALAAAGRGIPPPSRRPGGYAGRRAAPMNNSHRAVDEHLRHHPLSALTMEALQQWHSLGLRQLRRRRPDSANRDVSSVGREADLLPAEWPPNVAPGDPNRSPENDGVRAPSRSPGVRLVGVVGFEPTTSAV